MKKKILFGIAGIAFSALLMLNINIVKTVNSSHISLQTASMTAFAQSEETGFIYNPTYTSGTATQTQTQDGKTVTRNCTFVVIKCPSGGTSSCTEYSQFDCSGWS